MWLENGEGRFMVRIPILVVGADGAEFEGKVVGGALTAWDAREGWWGLYLDALGRRIEGQDLWRRVAGRRR